MKPPLVIGLTGGIGSGKSLAADCFSKLGVPIIDADQLALELVQPGQPALAEIASSFGPDILTPDGELDRTRMRALIFADAAGRTRLEAILHPKIRARIAADIALLHAPYCMLVIPLLLETGYTEMLDRILVVDVETETQIARVMQRDGASRDDVARIMATQVSREKRLAAADDVLDNSQNLLTLKCAVQTLHQDYLGLSKRPGRVNAP